jgi:hypothetical protein
MKNFYPIRLAMVIAISLFGLFSAGQKVTAYMDTVKATSFTATFVPGNRPASKFWVTGIYGAQKVSLELFKDKKKQGIRLNYPEKGTVIATGTGVASGKGVLTFPLPLEGNAAYRLMISMASDSAANFTIYSGYAFLPGLEKWKLIGTAKVTGYLPAMENPAPFYGSQKKDTTRPLITDEWAQKANGSWMRMDGQKMPSPVINLLSHADSISGIGRDIAIIEKAIADKKVEPLQKERGIYYQVMKEGTGKPIAVTDTVKVYYKGSLFDDGSVFDQTKDEPRSFPLSRLITGWQIGVPLIKEGGKIKLVIPSHLGYSIRTRSPKIPPNSILVFEIEVVEAKASPL